MSISFVNFSIKYPEFSESQIKFDLFLPDIEAEIAKYNWGTLLNKGTELLMAHALSLSGTNSDGSSGGSTGTLRELEIADDKYRVQFQDLDASNNYSLSKYGIEYQRLLKIVTGSAAESWNIGKGSTFLGKRVDSNPLKW